MDAPKFRIWPPIALGVPLTIGLLTSVLWRDPVSIDSPASKALGVVLVSAFVLWNSWALVMMARHQTALLPGGATTQIIQTGPFRWSRNPLYVGLIALALGLALLFSSFWAVVLVPVGVGALWWGAVRPEEIYLAAKFGPEYDAYRQRVRRWL